MRLAGVHAVLAVAGLMPSWLCVVTDLLEVTKQLTCMNYIAPDLPVAQRYRQEGKE